MAKRKGFPVVYRIRELERQARYFASRCAFDQAEKAYAQADILRRGLAAPARIIR